MLNWNNLKKDVAGNGFSGSMETMEVVILSATPHIGGRMR